MPLKTMEGQQIDAMIKERGCGDFKWIDPQKIGSPINVRTDYQQTMDRYAFLMVQYFIELYKEDLTQTCM